MNNDIANLCLVHRYLYYVLSEPIISDVRYDIMERQAKEECGDEHQLNSPGSSLKSSYSKDIIEQAEKLLSESR